MILGILVLRLSRIALGWAFIVGIAPMPNMVSMHNMQMERAMPSSDNAAASLTTFSGDGDLQPSMPCCDAISHFFAFCAFVASQASSDIQVGESEKVTPSLLGTQSIALSFTGPPPKI
jgi:hypothetical protein